MDVLQIKNLSFTYPGNSDKAIDNISFTVNDGDFVVLCGETGCGKTTLLRMLKRELAPVGERSGELYYHGALMEQSSDETLACEIGYVMQRPENQIVTHKVYTELAFGLENMGLPTPVIRRRVSEMSSYFGIGEWFHKDISELSGGQKQLLNLAAVMVMQPKVLLLDEPTAQLDPIAATDFIATLHKLNSELSLTILIAEHRLEEVLPIADRLMLMKDGKLVCCDAPGQAAGLLDKNDPMMQAMPGAVRLYHAFQYDTPCPLTVKDGRHFIEEHFKKDVKTLPGSMKTLPGSMPVIAEKSDQTAALELKNLWFRYQKEAPDILRGTTLTVNQQEILGILGENASGKSTLLGVSAGILKAYTGSVKIFGQKLQTYKNGALYKNNLALLPQDVETVFTCDTVQEDLEQSNVNITEIPFDISALLRKHPYDLSGGEQQLCALAKILGQNPRILLLDEPTKGIDACAKQNVSGILRDLRTKGMTILLVTHDIEFAAACADRCAMFFDGGIISEDVPELFFKENHFYTTAANRMTRNIYDNIVTVKDMIEICRLNGGIAEEEEKHA